MNPAFKISHKISPKDYLEDEQQREIRHEFVNGEIYAMAGESKHHNLITGNLYMILRNHLRHKSPCRVFMENVKTLVKTVEDERYHYPDLQVSCVPTSLQEYDESNPQLIVEVLLPATERYDRADKFYAYRKLSSLKEYVLIAQDLPRIEIYRRSKQWELELHLELTATFYLESVELAIPLAAIYESIEFASTSVEH